MTKNDYKILIRKFSSNKGNVSDNFKLNEARCH